MNVLSIVSITGLLICAVIIAAVLLSALCGWIFWLLWSWLLVGIFGAPALTFLQAWGLWFLISMIAGLLWRKSG